MTLNLSTLMIHMPATGDASADAGTSSAKSASSSDGAAFASALDAQIDIMRTAASLAGSSGSSSTTASQTADATDSLEGAALKRLQTLVENGSSVQDAAKTLADALATSVATQLGVTGDAAQAKLSTLFAQALSPPGTSPPALTADSARTLARRFRDIANDAAGAATTDAGQQNRLLGNILDAVTAKETPAPAATTIQSSSGIDPSTIAPAKVASVIVPVGENPHLMPVIGPVSHYPSAATDGASSGSSQALATAQAWRTSEASQAGGPSGLTVSTLGLANAGTGGDTLLGRMLTRAAIASSTSGSSPASATADAATKPVATAAIATPTPTPAGNAGSAAPILTALPALDTSAEPQAAPSTDTAAAAVDATATATATATDALPLLIVPAVAAGTQTTAPHSNTARGTEISNKIDAALGVAAARNAQTAISQANAGSGSQTGTAQTALSDAALGQAVTTATATNPDAALAAFIDAFKRAGGASQDAADSGSQTASSTTNQTQAFLASIGASTDVASTPQHVIMDGTAYTNATPTPTDPYNVVDQMVKGVFMRNLGPSQSEVRLRLVPESLGDVSVKLVVDGSSVSAQVLTQTADARNALLANHSALVRSLAEAGLKLQHFSVDVSSNGSNSFAQSQQQQYVPQRSLGGAAAPSGAETQEEEEQRLLAMPTFAPPVSGVANSGAVYALA